jgi:hypothetical protein
MAIGRNEGNHSDNPRIVINQVKITTRNMVSW